MQDQDGQNNNIVRTDSIYQCADHTTVCGQEGVRQQNVYINKGNIIIWVKSDMLCCSFCPSLAVVAALLKLSENVAGVTVLALGNGSPDIFSSVAGVNDGKTELVFNEIMGECVTLVITT